MKKKWTFFGVVFLAMFVVISAGFAADKTAPVAKNVILTPDEIQWKEGPKALPETKMAVLEGDPGKRGFFVARLKLPAGTKVPPHVHKSMERVTVISGKFNLAMGDKPENPKVLPAGSYFSLPPRTVHNAWADEDTILQISTYGPWTFKLVGKEAEKK